MSGGMEECYKEEKCNLNEQIKLASDDSLLEEFYDDLDDAGADLAWNHWFYIKSLLKAHKADAEDIEIIGFHYRTAMIHGFGHGREYERNLII